MQEVLSNRLKEAISALEVAAWDYILFLVKNGDQKEIEEILKKVPQLRIVYKNFIKNNIDKKT